MRCTVSFSAAIAVAVFTIPLAATAQKFQAPTPEELKMTSDPKVPGAPAVFLDRSETTDNFNHFIREYARIKVLTDEGKRWAEIPVPIAGDGRAPIVEARTIHPDGTVIPLAAAPGSLLQPCQKRAPSTEKCFTLPDAQVGSILEYRWTLPISDTTVRGVTPGQQEYQNSALASAIPYWDAQQDIFIHKEHFYYDPLSDQERNVIGNQNITRIVDGEIASYLLYSAHLPAGAQVQLSPRRDYTLDLQDVPAFVPEPNAPPAVSTRYAVRFYYTPYLSADVFWSSEGKRWSQSIDHAADPTSDLKAAAAQITAGAPDADAKALKLYDAVQSLTNTAFSPGSHADDPW